MKLSTLYGTTFSGSDPLKVSSSPHIKYYQNYRDMANPCPIPNYLLQTKRIICERDVTISDFLRDTHTMMALSKINFMRCLTSKDERPPFNYQKEHGF
jgi:hypothetical protein